MIQVASMLGLFLLFGMALQNIGYYLCFFVVPFFIYFRKELNGESVRRLRNLSIGLFLMWVIFPIANGYNYWGLETVHIPIDKLMKSHFNWAFVITACVLLLFSCKDFFRTTPKSLHPRLELESPKAFSLFTPFLGSLFIFSIIVTLYILFQQFFGLDYLGRSLPEERILASGIYRVSGFFGHPLTLAGVGLSLVGFVGALLMQKEHAIARWKLYTLLLCSTYFVFASGGRAAILIALAFLFLVFVFGYFSRARGFHLKKKRSSPLLKLILPLIALSIAAVVLYEMGLVDRFLLLADKNATLETERFIFWKVHWKMFLDSPWIGHGYSVLKAFRRDEYYELLGYASLERKYAAHNMFLEILTNVGLLGFLCIMVGLAYVAMALRTKVRTHQVYVRALFLSFLLNVVNGFTQNVFFDSSVLMMYLSFIMLIVWSELIEAFKETPRHLYRAASISPEFLESRFK